MPDIRMILPIAVALLLGACSAMEKVKDKVSDLVQPGAAEQKLSIGIKNYEDGNYSASLQSLNEAEKMGLSRKEDNVAVHKYKAFIYCITDRKNQCRHEFEDIFEYDPNFDLKPAEAGHPVWGPVFRSVKASGFAK